MGALYMRKYEGKTNKLEDSPMEIHGLETCRHMFHQEWRTTEYLKRKHEQNVTAK